MTATDELRRLLDERGVEHEDDCRASGGDRTRWGSNEFIEWCRGSWLTAYDITPEQAIAATLGETPTPPPPTPPKQPPYDELIESLRRDWDIEASWDGLRRFWYVGLTDEGVRKRDEREATLGRGTCHITDNGPWGYPYVCSECGASFDADVNNGEFNYCPNCGRRVEQ